MIIQDGVTRGIGVTIRNHGICPCNKRGARSQPGLFASQLAKKHSSNRAYNFGRSRLEVDLCVRGDHIDKDPVQRMVKSTNVVMDYCIYKNHPIDYKIIIDMEGWRDVNLGNSIPLNYLIDYFEKGCLANIIRIFFINCRG